MFEDAVIQFRMFEIVVYLLCQFAPITSASTLNDSCCSEGFSDDYLPYAPNRRAKEVSILLLCSRIEGSACVRLDVIDPQNCLSVYAVKSKFISDVLNFWPCVPQSLMKYKNNSDLKSCTERFFKFLILVDHHAMIVQNILAARIPRSSFILHVLIKGWKHLLIHVVLTVLKEHVDISCHAPISRMYRFECLLHQSNYLPIVLFYLVDVIRRVIVYQLVWLKQVVDNMPRRCRNTFTARRRKRQRFGSELLPKCGAL